LAILLFSVAALAQTETTMSCGIIDAGDADPDNPNYDFYCPSQYIIESCGLIYISVNVHFFVTDDCQGTTAASRAQDRKEQEDTYLEAEKLINRANRYNEGISDNLQWNQAVHGATVTTAPQCVPFRYVLEAVCTNIINTHPCCGRDDLISNNVMHYSVAATERSRAAMTPCQMSRALNTLFDEKCDLVRSVMPPCPPVSAFIGIVPSVSTNEDCAFTLHFESSMNESEHRIIVETLVGGVFRQPATPDWVDGRATDLSLAIGTNLNDKFADRIFLSNTTYRVTLETKSSCGGTANYSVEFTTGDCDLGATGGGIILISEGGMTVYPNPANHGTRLTYQLNAESDVQIYWASLDVNGQFTPPQLKSVESGLKTGGEYFVDFSNEDLKNGLNYIILQAGDEIHYRSVAKN
jgi:hypothetical protein